MNDKEIEQAIQAKGKTAPRITSEHIDEIICSEYYLTADKAVPDGDLYPRSLMCLTFCVLVLKNGFTVTGESACASPENFDADIGKKISRANAVQKIWQLEGYLLRQKLSEAE